VDHNPGERRQEDFTNSGGQGKIVRLILEVVTVI